MREIVTVFWCESCQVNVKIINTKPEDDNALHCPYCKNKLFGFDDYITESKTKEMF